MYKLNGLIIVVNYYKFFFPTLLFIIKYFSEPVIIKDDAILDANLTPDTSNNIINKSVNNVQRFNNFIYT